MTAVPTAADSAAGTAASSSNARPEVTPVPGLFFDTEINCAVSEPLTLTPTMLPWKDYVKLQQENQAEVARAKAQAPQQKKVKRVAISPDTVQLARKVTAPVPVSESKYRERSPSPSRRQTTRTLAAGGPDRAGED